MTVFQAQTNALVLPPFRRLPSNELTLSYAEHAANLRLHLSYFDEVTALAFNMAGMGFGIITSGIVEQQLFATSKIKVAAFNQIRLAGQFGARAVGDLGDHAFQLMNDGERGRWAFCGPQDALNALPGKAGHTLTLTMRDCLPCPGPDVPADEIIDFRRAFREDLSLLRFRFDEIRMAVSGGDIELATELFRKRLAADVIHIAATFEKQGMPYAKVGKSVLMQMPTIAGIALDAFLASVGGPAPVGSIGGALITAGLNHTKLAQTGNAYPEDYAYIVHGLREGIFRDFPGAEKEFNFQLESNHISNATVIGGYPRDIGVNERMSNCSFQSVHIDGNAEPNSSIVWLGNGLTTGGMRNFTSPASTQALLSEFAREWVAKRTR